MKSLRKKLLIFLLILFVVSLFIPFSSIFASDVPEVYTQHEDYKPGHKVMIRGEGFEAETTYTVVVTRPDGSIVKGDGSEDPGSDQVVTDKKGNFKYKYQLEKVSDNFDPSGIYTVEVTDDSGNIIANTTFTDSTVRW